VVVGLILVGMAERKVGERECERRAKLCLSLLGNVKSYIDFKFIF